MQVEPQVRAASFAENQISLGLLIKSLEEKCRNCKPLSAIVCLSDCKTWRLKNQLRMIHARIQRPDFVEQLLNTLKNERRLQLLDIISRQHRSIAQLQEGLRSLGHCHSQQTIIEEYVAPLIEVGLIQDEHNPYAITLLGSRVEDLVKDFQDLEQTLPAHSECYEEEVLGELLERPRTHEEIRNIIPTKSAPRVLSRLNKTRLVQTDKEKNYIFFFKTKRDSRLSKLSETEDKVYSSIPEDGIPSNKLSEKSHISLRRTYKYLRKLKGKKLVFARKKPLRYSLTSEGMRLAEMLKALRKLAAETRAATDQFLRDEEQFTERSN